jgi:hypothetical protein
MTTTELLEKRMDALEQEVAELRSRVEHKEPPQDWLQRFFGAFADSPDFDEVIQAGADIRQADRDKAAGEGT